MSVSSENDTGGVLVQPDTSAISQLKKPWWKVALAVNIMLAGAFLLAVGEGILHLLILFLDKVLGFQLPVIVHSILSGMLCISVLVYTFEHFVTSLCDTGERILSHLRSYFHKQQAHLELRKQLEIPQEPALLNSAADADKTDEQPS
jgi:hypothetical protein